MRVRRRVIFYAIPAVVGVVAVLATRLERMTRSPEVAKARQELFAELQPVKLANCTLKRFGHPHDGGYLLCDNLLEGVESAYSYGIEGRDDWGCQISLRSKVTVHQYDCFDPIRPKCPGGSTAFHEECIGAEASTWEGKAFDTLAGQIAKNGDVGKRLLVKMDVEGAEWTSLLGAPEATLERIDQLALELHDFDTPRARDVLRRLKQTFFVVNVHFNNNACTWLTSPFPGTAWEVLFVNRRLGVLDPAGKPELPNRLDAPNISYQPDCQPAW